MPPEATYQATLQAIRADAAKYGLPDASGIDIVKLLVLKDGFRFSSYFRVGHALRKRNLRRTSAVLTRIIRRAFASDVSLDADLGPGLFVPHPVGIVIGADVRVGSQVMIGPKVTLGGNLGKSSGGRTMASVGDRVTVLSGAVVAGPITVGDDVLIGANAVVTSNIPAQHRVSAGDSRVASPRMTAESPTA